MSKREKVILVIMAVTIVYGGYALLINPYERPGGPTTTASASKLDKFNQFITNVSTMTKGGLSEIDSYILHHLPDEWTKDPLLDSSRDFEFKKDQKTDDQMAKQLALRYTGFVSMGDQKIAIIDGTEYETGEAIPESDLVVAEIYSNRVVIFMKASNKGVSVPIEEVQ